MNRAILKNIEITYIRNDGGRFPALLNAFFLKGMERTLDRIPMALMDFAERKRMKVERLLEIVHPQRLSWPVGYVHASGKLSPFTHQMF